MLDGASETEMVWHIRKAYWKRGIATEAAKAARDVAFQSFGIQRLVAIIHPDHVASRRVAENIGMRFEKATIFEGDAVVVYAIAAIGSAAPVTVG